MPDKYQFSILKTEEELIEYETGLFNAFKTNPNGWTFHHYHKIENCRLKNMLPYDDLVIYLCKKNNKIVSAITFNLNKNNMELSQMEFSIDLTQENIVEALTLFAKEEERCNIYPLLVDFRYFIWKDVKKRGINTVYGTIEKRFFDFHTRIFKWDLLETKVVRNVDICLLRTDVSRWDKIYL